MTSSKRKDHSARAQREYFVGYQDRQPVGYRVYLSDSKEIIISYRVAYIENPNDVPEFVESYADEEIDMKKKQQNFGIRANAKTKKTIYRHYMH